MRIIETPENIVLADISDISHDLDTVYLRADINEPPRPSLRVEQTVRTILAIRKLQKKRQIFYVLRTLLSPMEA